MDVPTRGKVLLFVAGAWLAAGGCGDRSTPETAKGVSPVAEVNQSVSFDDVNLGATEEHACSPRFASLEELGILINSPLKVAGVIEDLGGGEKVLAETTRFPVCITMQVPTALTAQFPEIADRVTLVAVDSETGGSFSGNLTSTRTRAPRQRFDQSQGPLANSIRIWRYNVNLCRYLRLPGKPATYHVYATFEEYRSNSLTVKVE